MEAPTGMQIFVSHRLLRIVSGPRDTDADLTPKPNTREKRESYFSEWTTCRFLRSLPRNLQRMAIFNHKDDSDS